MSEPRPPTYEMDWESAMDKIQHPNKEFSVKVMTKEGIWIEPTFHAVKLPNSDELRMNYHQPGNNIFSWANVPAPISATTTRSKHCMACSAVAAGSIAKKSSTQRPVGMRHTCSAASCRNCPTLFQAWTLPAQ